MEANTIINMAEYKFYHRCFIIYAAVSEDGRKKRDVIKHPSKGVRVQVINSSKGKLD